MTLTDHLRRYLASGEPDLPLLAALAELVRERIQRSGMWGQPPEYFGYPEYQSWQEAFSGDDPSPGPAGDFFLEEIVPELTFFEQTIRAGNAVEALLRQKVKWFLIDRQKKHDPIGYRAFMNLVAVIEVMLADGVATATNLVRGKVRNPTLVRLGPAASATLADERELARVIDSDADWQPVLRRLAKLGKGAQGLLRQRLGQFPSAGVAVFCVGELGAVLKARARAASEAWNRPVEGSPPWSPGATDDDPSRTRGPHEGYFASEDDMASFSRRVREAVEQSDYTDKVKRGMLVVFEDWLKYLAAGEDPPQVREWASQVGLPKSSLSDNKQRLRPLMGAALGQRQTD